MDYSVPCMKKLLQHSGIIPDELRSSNANSNDSRIGKPNAISFGYSFGDKNQTSRITDSSMPDITWKKLCEAIMRETDPQKLLALVEELNRTLDQREKELKIEGDTSAFE